MNYDSQLDKSEIQDATSWLDDLTGDPERNRYLHPGYSLCLGRTGFDIVDVEVVMGVDKRLHFELASSEFPFDPENHTVVRMCFYALPILPLGQLIEFLDETAARWRHHDGFQVRCRKVNMAEVRIINFSDLPANASFRERAMGGELVIGFPRGSILSGFGTNDPALDKVHRS